MLDRDWIERHIPHRGRMCLLDHVLSWDAERIRCRTATHRDADHPLRAHGQLGIACGIEYAAQAMAVHGALLANAAAFAGPGITATGSAVPAPAPVPAAGVLASVRGVRPRVLRLDDVPGDLYCDAQRVAGDGATAMYEFELRSDTSCLLTGRATVVLDAAGRLRP